VPLLYTSFNNVGRGWPHLGIEAITAGGAVSA